MFYKGFSSGGINDGLTQPGMSMDLRHQRGSMNRQDIHWYQLRLQDSSIHLDSRGSLSALPILDLLERNESASIESHDDTLEWSEEEAPE